MGLVHLFFVVINFRTLGRLYGRLNQRFPGSVDGLWDSQSMMQRIDLLLGPAVFAKRAMLFNLAVAQPQYLPPVIMGDDEVSNLVFKLNRHWTVKIYQLICRLIGFS